MKIGMYNFQWAGGEFEVEFREKNIFWCKRFANEASWTEVQPGVVGVNWGKYGNYQLTAQPDGSFAGGVLTTDASGAPVVNTNDWRKATFVRAFTPAEELLSGSAWMLHYENGVPFRVEFHADGHFHSPAYPGHHLWKASPATRTHATLPPPAAARPPAAGLAVPAACHACLPPPHAATRRPLPLRPPLRASAAAATSSSEGAPLAFSRLPSHLLPPPPALQLNGNQVATSWPHARRSFLCS